MVKPKERPPVPYGATYRIVAGCGNFYVTVNVDEGRGIFEVFTQMGKAGGCSASQADAGLVKIDS
jgi:ribonucleoside-diphosphate reductase alpha chain